MNFDMIKKSRKFVSIKTIPIYSYELAMAF